jgi:DNA-binding MarR family transcriptional regulator
MPFNLRDAMTRRAAGQSVDAKAESVCTNAAIRRAARRLGNLYDSVLTPCELRGTQYSLLVQVQRSGRPTMRELADALVMDLSALGHTLKPLARDGFLELVPDEQDGRSRRVVLTRAGTAKLKAARALWAKAQAGFDLAFGAKKAAQLRTALDFISSPDFLAQMSAAMHSQ